MRNESRLLIVDGNNLLFQMFYGIPTKIYNRRGRTIHATIGFISALQREIKTFGVSRCIVVFDGDCSKERKELLDSYKANRTQNWDELPNDEVPFFEEEYIKDCLCYLNVCVLESEGMEADDLIASIALKESAQMEVLISSYDSDFFQLINEKISVLRYRGEHTKLVTAESFEREFSFPPSRYAFYKSLTGDSADNIKGAPSIGKKRATEIVKRFETFSDLRLGDLSFLPPKARADLTSAFPLIERNLALISLCTKEIGKYCSEFDGEKMQQRNSQILTACHVFE